MKIRVLNDEVVNKIAAGEVVERPSSVVRELVENSFDAGAQEVRVYLERGGHSLIRVVDDGTGMERDDALLALERHATSKIVSADDLLAIQTMGFRGEALPSIAAVSKVTIRTRTAEQEVGTEVEIHGGIIKTVKSVPLQKGSEFEIRSLFFNTPVRRKFLKSPHHEEMRVKQWMIGASLCRPQVRLRLFFDGKETLNLSRAESIESRARTIFRGGMVRVHLEARNSDELGIEGSIGHPSQAVADSGTFLLLVNGRVVSDRALLRAVKDGFSTTLKAQEFPVGFLSLKLPPQVVDVNVHPQKSEVRFVDGAKIFVAVRDTIARAVNDFRAPLEASSRVASVTPLYSTTSAFGASQGALPRPYSSSFVTPRESATGEQMGLLTPGPAHSEESIAGEMREVAQPAPLLGPFTRFSDLRYIGQALQCYLFTEFGGRVYVVDMHAAHERYNFNLVRNALRAKSTLGQSFLLPLKVVVGERGVFNLEYHLEFLQEAGFFVERENESSFRVLSAPALLKISEVENIIKEFAAVPSEESPLGKLQERLDYIAARIACHASVRSGDLLDEREVYALFASLDSTEFSAACPHGRPIIISLSEDEISRWFGRDK